MNLNTFQTYEFEVFSIANEVDQIFSLFPY